MHNNYYFLKQLVPALETQLKWSVLTACFSQNKDELILEFQKEANSFFYIKAYQKSDFSCLSFPNQFHRARKNSIDLFGTLLGQKVITVRMFRNERAFVLNFSNTDLLFKLYGNQSNVILYKDGNQVELFKNNLKGDKLIDINQLDRDLDITFDNLVDNEFNVRNVIPTIDKVSAQILFNRLSDDLEIGKKRIFDEFMAELNSSNFYLQAHNEGFKLSLINTENSINKYSNPIIAITSFFEKEVKHKSLFVLKSKILANLKGQLRKSKNYIIKLKHKLKELSIGSSNQQKADIIMANMQLIIKGSKQVELLNFYTDSIISIKLNPLQSPQKNAERYYRKAKNEAKEVAILSKNIEEKEYVINNLIARIKEVEETDNIKMLLKWMPKKKTVNSEIIVPYKEFYVDEYKILVGKNAKHNDTLTLKIAKKDDLWLHAKDVSGSHVVIKQIPGRNYPAYIIEKAAQLAAFYSKRKTDSLCPVLYTPKKYVRKKKGTPAGAMFVEKEKVVLVEPSNSF